MDAYEILCDLEDARDTLEIVRKDLSAINAHEALGDAIRAIDDAITAIDTQIKEVTPRAEAEEAAEERAMNADYYRSVL